MNLEQRKLVTLWITIFYMLHRRFRRSEFILLPKHPDRLLESGSFPLVVYTIVNVMQAGQWYGSPLQETRTDAAILDRLESYSRGAQTPVESGQTRLTSDNKLSSSDGKLAGPS